MNMMRGIRTWAAAGALAFGAVSAAPSAEAATLADITGFEIGDKIFDEDVALFAAFVGVDFVVTLASFRDEIIRFDPVFEDPITNPNPTMSLFGHVAELVGTPPNQAVSISDLQEIGVSSQIASNSRRMFEVVFDMTETQNVIIGSERFSDATDMAQKTLAVISADQDFGFGFVFGNDFFRNLALLADLSQDVVGIDVRLEIFNLNPIVVDPGPGAAVPLPAAFPMLALGVGVLAFVARRRTRA